MQALAEDDRPALTTVDERIQADVDTIVAERISLHARVAEMEEEVERLTKALRTAKRDLDTAGEYTGEARVRIALNGDVKSYSYSFMTKRN